MKRSPGSLIKHCFRTDIKCHSLRAVDKTSERRVQWHRVFQPLDVLGRPLLSGLREIDEEAPRTYWGTPGCVANFLSRAGRTFTR